MAKIVGEIKELRNHCTGCGKADMRAYKTKDVKKMFGCSDGTLKSMRASGRLRTKKIGGTLYYNKEDIQRLVGEGF